MLVVSGGHIGFAGVNAFRQNSVHVVQARFPGLVIEMANFDIYFAGVGKVHLLRKAKHPIFIQPPDSAGSVLVRLGFPAQTKSGG